MEKRVLDLTCDLGESYGPYIMGRDEEIMPRLSSANVACGFHAGDMHVMRKTVQLAKKHNVRVGAHPGLPDRVGFGRRKMVLSASELKDIFTYQIGALKAFLEAGGMTLQHVFPHGALTAMIEQDENLARAVLEATLETESRPVFLSLSGSRLVTLAEKMGVRVARVALADRAYKKDGTTVNRREPGAVIHDISAVAERIEELVKDGVARSVDDERIEIEFESILLHGDSPGSIRIAETVYETLKKTGVALKPLDEIVP